MYSSFSKKFRQIKPYDNYNVTDVPWHEAMVAGNGRLGVLESCAPIEDSLIYQNVEFVMPSEEPRHVPYDVTAQLDEARQSVINFDDTWNIHDRKRTNMYCYHPGHMIRLTLEGEPDISGYRRWTDYKTGTINTTFKSDGASVSKSTYVSRKQNVIITKIISEKSVNMSISTDDFESMPKFGVKKNNIYIKTVLPRIFYVDHERRKSSIQEDLIMLQGGTEYADLKDNVCIFDKHKMCNQCFNCIGIINRKKPEQLSLLETARLMQYKLFNFNLANFENKLNEKFKNNGGIGERIHYQITFDAEKLMHVDTIVHNEMRDTDGDVNDLSDGLNSIYILSLLETYAEYGSTVPYIILIEDPEIYLHPQLQKIASEILYKLSRKNQVIFCTHSPQMLFNFTTRQIRQVINDRDNNTVATPEADIDDILDDLGYAANDLMNVSFVFIVEGKQDRSRLPLLLEKYYSEVIDENGNLNRIAIIATNSCTNIKTYANLKYINTLYLKDEFLMIRDGDGKDADRLRDQLTNYYKQRAKQDYGNLPRVTDRNVLILKYYSFENYFLDPEIMTKIGVVKSVDQFYDILYAKYKEYLYRLVSTKKMLEKLNIAIETRQDIIDNMENIRKYVRGHNLYDIFYGRYKGEKENAILRAYIDAAPRENFDDIFDAIDNFVYFNNRRND